MLKNMLTSAVFAGVAVGLIATILQFWLVMPMLLQGEMYESGALVHFATDGSTQSTPARPDLLADLSRSLMTLGFNTVAWTGFAFLLVAGYALFERRGGTLTVRQGLLWGLAGFIAVQLAPAIGLPPELPGTIRADVGLRQAWWMFTVLCSIAALGMIAFGQGPLPIIVGFGLLALPHIISAPALDTFSGVAPPELSSNFATRSLGVSAAAWAVLGLIAAALWVKQREEA